VTAAAVIGGGLLWWRLRRMEAAATYDGAVAALAARRWDEAEQLGRRLTRTPRFAAQGWLIAGEAAARQGAGDRALACYQAVPQDGSSLARTALLACGELYLKALPALAEADRVYRQVLAAEPHNLVANERLAYVLGLQGRAGDAAVHRLALLRQGKVLPLQLVLLALGDTADENPETPAVFHKAHPDDVLAQLAVARIDTQSQRLAAAQARLTQVVAERPDLVRAQAVLGRILLFNQGPAACAAWDAGLPAGADASPDIWVVRGDMASQTDQPRVAVRCYGEAIRRDPNHLGALYRLARALRSVGQAPAADPFLERARRVEQLANAARTYQIARIPTALEQAAATAQQLGLAWESWAWYEVLASVRPLRDEERQQQQAALAEARASPDDRTVARGLPLAGFALAAYPLPAKSLPPAVRSRPPHSGGTTPPAANADGDPGIAFRDDAAAAGIDFRYFNSSRRETASEFMYEFSGGGVAVLDFDRDGWPDLYFTQGTDWPPREDNFRYLDRLYRNTGAGRFVDVTEAAGIREQRFGQGVAAGDFDNDGFLDLLVGNIGLNRLFHNNGDGTFTDVTEAVGFTDTEWTSSCVIADFNGDGFPDLYAVHYLVGEHLFDRPCRMADGSPRLCTPHEFPASQDRLYLNRGDGRFTDVTAEAGLVVPDGKGLGVVAADFDGSGRLSLFVANDAVPNFLFVNETSPPGAPPRFREQGLVAGVAVDGEGRSQASMGVAAGDADGNGLLDLYATAFRNEANTLYLQHDKLFWSDETRRAGLFEATFDLLAFGTQFLDADLDGRPDLVLTNGHVGDLRHHGVPYHMRPQFFRNVGNGRFVELQGVAAGAFFADEYLGRGLARIDWNRDGREDFVVQHLDSPAALVTNHTARPGHFLALQLIGTRGARDAIGTIVRVTAGGQTRVGQLTAGDGYMASNQRQLLFGLAGATTVERLEIAWPGGGRSVFTALRADQELQIVEGCDRPFAVPR
jgi:tetratricopeptide (TPR) repeat protein